MDGVTVVETISKTVDGQPYPWILIVGLAVMSLIAICNAKDEFRHGRALEALIVLAVVPMSVLVGVVASVEWYQNLQSETVYIVQLDYSASAKEFYEKYEVLDVDEDKLTVRLIAD